MKIKLIDGAGTVWFNKVLVPATFKTGRRGYKAQAQIVIGGERFWVNCLLVELR